MDSLTFHKNIIKHMRELFESSLSLLAATANTAKNKCTFSPREQILYGGVSKLLETGGGILALSFRPFPDEMICLMRTSLELIVNICYLQTASEEEVKRYRDFILLPTANAAFWTRPLWSEDYTLPEERIQDNTRAIKEETDFTPGKSTQWSKNRTIHARAKEIDRSQSSQTFERLVSTYYPLASAYAHGEYRLIVGHARYLGGFPLPPKSETLFHTGNALQAAIHLLCVLIRYLSGGDENVNLQVNDLDLKAAELANIALKESRFET